MAWTDTIMHRRLETVRGQNLQCEEFLGVLYELANMEEIQKRRSDPYFTDLPRYIVDSKFILENLKHLKLGAKILDIGAGAGVFSILLQRLGFNVTATNLVITKKSQRAEINFFRKFEINFIPLNLDKQTIPVQDNYYDAILCMHVIEHLKVDALCALLEMWRVLRPGGKAIIMTPNGIATMGPRFIKKLRVLLDGAFTALNLHTKEYTLRELISMLKRCDFEIYSGEYSNEMILSTVARLKVARKALTGFYCSVSKLFPTLSYEIHIAAQKRTSKVGSKFTN